MMMGNLMVYPTYGFWLFLLLMLTKFVKRVWWTPIRIQYALRSQGIKGPAYKFLRGNTEDISNMSKEATSRPMQLSHDVLPIVLPHIYMWTKLYGENFLMYTPRAELVVSKPEMIKEVLANKDGMYQKGKGDEYVEKLLGDGLVTTQGNEKWSKLRKLANHAFHGDSLKGMIPAMIESTETMLKRWKLHDGKEIEVFQEFRILTSEVISRTAFGSSYLEGEHTFSMLIRLAIIISRNRYKVKIPILGEFMKTQDDIESKELEKGIRNSVINIIKKREEAAPTGQLESYGSDYLGLLLKSNHDSDKALKLKVNDVIDECKTFYVAGHESTTTLLTWTMFLLGLHTDWQDKAREEVLQLCGHQDPAPDDISRLKKMSMIIYESLRLYPPVIYFSRLVARRTKLGNLILPQDLHVSFPTLALHHDPRIWGEDVHLFKPERFAEGVAKATNNDPSAFFPFGMGPRNCVGSNFALTETKVALSMILQRHKFTLSPNYIHSPTYQLTIIPEHGVQVKLQAL